MRKPDRSVLDRDWVTIDRAAAARATVLAASILVVLLLLQGAVAAALTGGTQPMHAVDSVPASPSSEVWDEAPSHTVSLSKQQMAVPFGGGTTDELSVKAVTNESHVAFRLSWRDPTNDTSIASPRRYSDAVAVMLHSGRMPPITMGAVGTPVNIWYWRASWQFGASDGAWTGDMYTYPHPNNVTKPGQAVGNPLSKDRYDQLAHNYYAKGYGSLSHAPVQPVHASARRSDNGWTVTFVRERGTNGRFDARFESSEPMYLAFAVWNGSANEVNGMKSITMRFTRLDPANASLSAASSGNGGPGSGTVAGSGTAGVTGLNPGLGGWLSVLIGATLFTWLLSYRRLAT